MEVRYSARDLGLFLLIFLSPVLNMHSGNVNILCLVEPQRNITNKTTNRVYLLKKVRQKGMLLSAEMFAFNQLKAWAVVYLTSRTPPLQRLMQLHRVTRGHPFVISCNTVFLILPSHIHEEKITNGIKVSVNIRSILRKDIKWNFVQNYSLRLQKPTFWRRLPPPP